MITSEQIYKAYNFFYKKKYSSKKYEIEQTERNNKFVKSYLSLLQKHYNLLWITLGEDYLWTYFSYQFNYWDPLSIQSVNKKINLALIIGKKAFLRYEQRDKEYDFTLSSLPIFDKYNLTKQDFRIFIFLNTKEQQEDKGDEYEYIRRIKYNTEEGLVLCMQNTNLFQESSATCFRCNFKTECKQIKLNL